MQFNVSSLLKEHTGATREFDIDDDVRIDLIPRRLKGHVRMDRTPRGIFVRAAAEGAADDVCSRCLQPLTYPVRIALEEEYLPSVDVTSGARVAVDEGDEDAYRIDARHVLDLAEPVRQYWTMALEMAPVCREDCAGLCPACGEYIADGVHQCAGEQVDTRWSKLAELRLG